MENLMEHEILLSNISYLLEKSNEKYMNIEKKMGVSQGYFSRIIKYRRMPDLHVILKISDYFKVDYNTLLTREMRMEKDKEEEYYITNFLEYLLELSYSTPSQLEWNKRVNMCSDCYLARGFYEEYYDKELYVEDRIFFECTIPQLDIETVNTKVKLYRIKNRITDEMIYELDINGLLVCSGLSKNKSYNKYLVCLYDRICKPLDKKNTVNSSIAIIKKYVDYRNKNVLW